MSKPAVAPVVKAGKVTHLYGIKLTQPLTVTPHLTVLVQHAGVLADVWTGVTEYACDIFRILLESAGIDEKDVMFPEAVPGESTRSFVARFEPVFLEHAFPSLDLQSSPVLPWIIDKDKAQVTHLFGKKLPTPWHVNHMSDALRADSLYLLYLEVQPHHDAIKRDLKALWPDMPTSLFQHNTVYKDFRAVEEWLREHTNSPEPTPAPAQPQDPTNYKLDSGKLDYTLLMHDMAPAVRQVVNCLHWGHYTKGYPRNGYKTLSGGTDRLVAACYRHMAAMAEDFNALDEESGLPHAIHAVTNLLMALSQED